jgi:hypothetical protein
MDSIGTSETSESLRTSLKIEDLLCHKENIRPYLMNLINVCLRLSYKELIFACPIHVLYFPFSLQKKKTNFIRCTAVGAAVKHSPPRPQVRRIYFCGRIHRYIYEENKQAMINDLKK